MAKASDTQRIRQQSVMGGWDTIAPAFGGTVSSVSPVSFGGGGGGGYDTPSPLSSPFKRASDTFGDFGASSPSFESKSEGLKSEDLSKIEPPKVHTYGEGTTIEDIMKIVNRTYTPETTSRDRFNTLLDAPPERNEPSFARKLVASGLSMKAEDPIKTAESVMYAPYLREAADWTAKTGPYQQAAQLENTANVNERTLAGNMANAQVQLNRTEQQRVEAEEKARIASATQESKAETDMIRARAYAFAQTHPDYKWDFSGTTVKVMGPDGVPQDTGMATDKVDQMTQITLQNQGRLAVAQQGAINAQVSGAQYWRDPDTGQIFSVNPRVPGSVPPQGSVPATRGPETAAQDMGQRNMQFVNLWDNYPESHQFLTPPTTPTGRWDLKPPMPKDVTWGPFGADQYDQNEINAYNEVRKALGFAPWNPTGAQQQQAPLPPVNPATRQGLGPPTATPPLPQQATPQVPFTGPTMPPEMAPQGPMPVQPMGGQMGTSKVPMDQVPISGIGGVLGTGTPMEPGQLPYRAGIPGVQAPQQAPAPQQQAPPTGQNQFPDIPRNNPEGDILFVDLETGKPFYISPQNAQRALQTGRYQQVQ